MANQRLKDILARDVELTAFMHYVLDHRNESIPTTIDNFPFQLIAVNHYREKLIRLGSDARRYPHRVPPK